MINRFITILVAALGYSLFDVANHPYLFGISAIILVLSVLSLLTAPLVEIWAEFSLIGEKKELKRKKLEAKKAKQEKKRKKHNKGVNYDHKEI